MEAQHADVWMINVASWREHLSSLRAVLSNAERARADRFYFAEDSERFTVAHGALRNILASYVGRAPEELKFAENEFGKPGLNDAPGLAFNLSHSGDLVLVALCAGGEIGVDIEQHRVKLGWENIAKQVFSLRECMDLDALPVSDRSSAFFNAWVRKEAFIKALGLGFSYPTDSFSVPLSSEIPDPCLIADQQGMLWRLRLLRVPSGYSAAVVTRGEEVTSLRQQHYSPIDYRNG